MKQKHIFIVVVALLSSIVCNNDSFPCFQFIKEGNGFYNLKRISGKENLVINTIDNDNIDIKIEFNLCFPMKNPHCSNESSIGFITKFDNTCYPLSYPTTDKTNATSWKFAPTDAITPDSNENHDNFKNKKLQGNPDFGNRKGLQIQGATKKQIGYDIIFDLKCNINADKVQNLTAVLDTNNKLLTITLESINACSFDILSIWNRLGMFQYLITGLIATAAVTICLFGVKIYKASLRIMGF